MNNEVKPIKGMQPTKPDYSKFGSQFPLSELETIVGKEGIPYYVVGSVPSKVSPATFRISMRLWTAPHAGVSGTLREIDFRLRVGDALDDDGKAITVGDEDFKSLGTIDDLWTSSGGSAQHRSCTGRFTCRGVLPVPQRVVEALAATGEFQALSNAMREYMPEAKLLAPFTMVEAFAAMALRALPEADTDPTTSVYLGGDRYLIWTQNGQSVLKEGQTINDKAKTKDPKTPNSTVDHSDIGL